MEEWVYPQIVPVKKTGKEPIHDAGRPVGITLLDFWSWQGSQLLDNSMRGLLAEYYVAAALGTAKGSRVEWDGHDCLLPNGIKVEVKAAGYIQSWPQHRLSVIQFDIAPRQAWTANTNTYSEVPARQANVYVFCLHAHKDQGTIDPLDLSQWEFYVLPTSELNIHAPRQKRISLSALLNRFKPVRASFHELKRAVLSAACDSGEPGANSSS